jgi:hypothetical protein
MREKESWMFKGATVLALGKKAIITKMQENTLNEISYVYYISCKLEGEKKSGQYHPNDVQLFPIYPAQNLKENIDKFFKENACMIVNTEKVNNVKDYISRNGKPKFKQ